MPQPAKTETPLLLIKPALLPLKRQELEQIEERLRTGSAWDVDIYLLLSEVKRLRKTYEP